MTSLRAAGTDQVTVVLDGEPALTLTAVAAHRLGLRRGLTVDDALWQRVAAVAEAEAAEATAARWLAARARTREDLRRRLTARFSPDAVAGALDHLQATGAIDDLAFAHRWLDTHSGSRALGRPALVAGLIREGISSPEAKRLVAEHVGEGDGAAEAESAIALAKAAAARYRNLPPDRAARRLWAYLARRGFGAAEARQAVHAALAIEVGEDTEAP